MSVVDKIVFFGESAVYHAAESGSEIRTCAWPSVDVENVLPDSDFKSELTLGAGAVVMNNPEEAPIEDGRMN